MKKFLLRFLFIFFLISLVGFAVSPNFVFAQKELEVKYPEIEEFKPETTKTLLPDYVKYIFNFLIWASGFIALGALIYGGFKYLTSIGMPEKLKDAKEQIAAALLGLLVLFASYLILITINPQLVIFRLGPIAPIINTLKSGVLVCKEPERDKPPLAVIHAWNLINEAKDEKTSVERKREIRDQLAPIIENISKYCYYIERGDDVRKEFDNKIKYVYSIPGEEKNPAGLTVHKYYGLIIYEDKGFRDKNTILFASVLIDRPIENTEFEFNGIKISSVRPYVVSKPIETNSEKAVLYEEIDFNFGGDPSKQYKDIGLPGNKFREVYGLSFVPQSVEIEGNYIILLSSTTESEVFVETGDRDLNNNRVACWGWHCKWFGISRWCKRSCVEAAVTIRGKVY